MGQILDKLSQRFVIHCWGGYSVNKKGQSQRYTLCGKEGLSNPDIYGVQLPLTYPYKPYPLKTFSCWECRKEYLKLGEKFGEDTQAPFTKR